MGRLATTRYGAFWSLSQSYDQRVQLADEKMGIPQFSYSTKSIDLNPN